MRRADYQILGRSLEIWIAEIGAMYFGTR